ncbi:hypothetical protein P9112_009742 [Eukaryota sp. TZLM1-RC]
MLLILAICPAVLSSIFLLCQPLTFTSSFLWGLLNTYTLSKMLSNSQRHVLPRKHLLLKHTLLLFALTLLASNDARSTNKCRASYAIPPPLPSPSPHSIITVVVNTNFIPDLIALSSSLSLTNTTYPLTCLVSPLISERDVMLLTKYCTNVLMFDLISLPFSSYHKHFKWHRTFEMIKALNKINVWRINEMEMVSKVEQSHPLTKSLYLDSDCLVQHKVTNFTEFPELSACSGPPQSIINSGVMVFNPNITTFNKIVELLRSRRFPSGFGDQALIGQYFSDRGDVNILSDDWNFRTYLDKKHPTLLTESLILHFNGRLKPSSFDLNSSFLLRYLGKFIWGEHRVNTWLRMTRGIFERNSINSSCECFFVRLILFFCSLFSLVFFIVKRKQFVSSYKTRLLDDVQDHLHSL